MTRKVSTAEAKRRLSSLVKHVQRGDRVLIHKKGLPAAALVPVVDLKRLAKDDADNRPGAILDCVGLFADFPEWHQIMEEVVASRGRDKPRKVRIG